MTTPKPASGRLIARLIRLGRHDDARFLVDLAKARSAVANDNVPAGDIGADTAMVFRPTVEEIRRASIKTKDGKPDPTGEIGLRFSAKGELIEWRVAEEDGTPRLGKDGEEIWLKPVERYRQPKGKRRRTSAALSADNNAHGSWLMSLRGTGKMPPAWIPDTRYASACRVLARLTAAMVGYAVSSRLRDDLRTHSVDGEHTLEQCSVANPQATVQRCKPGLAWKVDFLCGKPDANPMATEGSFVGAPDAAEMTMIAAIDANGQSVSAVLDMALAGMTMREIAAANGWGNTKHAERRAVAEVDAAIAELRRAA